MCCESLVRRRLMLDSGGRKFWNDMLALMVSLLKLFRKFQIFFAKMRKRNIAQSIMELDAIRPWPHPWTGLW